ncbi:MAG: hypothetical protein KH138_11855 [Firmicutes bacterium]|nr:hypothetical protein [Bacillota bacterium]
MPKFSFFFASLLFLSVIAFFKKSPYTVTHPNEKSDQERKEQIVWTVYLLVFGF